MAWLHTVPAGPRLQDQSKDQGWSRRENTCTCFHKSPQLLRYTQFAMPSRVGNHVFLFFFYTRFIYGQLHTEYSNSQVPSHFARCQIWHLAPNLETLDIPSHVLAIDLPSPSAPMTDYASRRAFAILRSLVQAFSFTHNPPLQMAALSVLHTGWKINSFLQFTPSRFTLGILFIWIFIDLFGLHYINAILPYEILNSCRKLQWKPPHFLCIFFKFLFLPLLGRKINFSTSLNHLNETCVRYYYTG